MDVVFIAPAYPPEMPEFTRGLAEVGARVHGIGDTPLAQLSPKVKAALTSYLQVPALLHEDDVLERAHHWLRGRSVDRVESLWEPTVLLAARMRERFGVPGMSVDCVTGFRDKQLMKERIAAAGLRVPHSARCRTNTEVRDAAERIGYPLIIKPIDGAGSANTYRVDSEDELDRVLPRLARVPEVSTEEFIEGEEFTYDTICIEGTPVYENVAQYLPRPLIARTVHDISPVICTVRNLDQPAIRRGIELGRGVLEALSMGTGFTHLEWYLKANGEVVFGEVGCRVGGARLIDQMNYTSDCDLYREWARAVCWHAFEADTTRQYNAAIVFKRAYGRGRIHRIEGLREFVARNRQWLCTEDLLPVGAHRRDWTQTLVSDGYVIVRHPEWAQALRIAKDAADNVRLFAG
ncbi:ATP-grasp domain-containing protein [Paraliomyxa miuraensis]|uniref:ATP-grasp domain-containing protein n=1 Tax=Paraliomyxa miuraensis TaxID=376150 RepID=UPI00225B296A|nr:ATP-grasp domain-containing protein [Paraliomyxa miuraensis]MCX4240610.1 ATP-grasp domain-containing protein [Paraliomyxa miuraensis]